MHNKHPDKTPAEEAPHNPNTHGLPEGGGQGLQEGHGVHGVIRVGPRRLLPLLLQALLCEHLLLDVGRQGGQELGVHLPHNGAVVLAGVLRRTLPHTLQPEGSINISNGGASLSYY